jgi:predicted phosphate transport protein (TIGR00153 family)
MRFSFIPREMKFFDMLDEFAVILSRASGKFLEMITKFDDLPTRGLDIKSEEEAADAVVEKILNALGRTFITPFDREDIHNLASSLDDIMDNLEETSHRFEVFRIDRPTRATIQLASIIAESCQHVAHAIRLLRHLHKPADIQAHILNISRLENEADQLYREVDAALFDNTAPRDVLELIKWRELYGWLEETVDACKEVANHISEIVIKGS